MAHSSKKYVDVKFYLRYVTIIKEIRPKYTFFSFLDESNLIGAKEHLFKLLENIRMKLTLICLPYRLLISPAITDIFKIDNKNISSRNRTKWRSNSHN